MTFNPRQNSSKRQREMDQRDRAAERAARREERKARAAERSENGQVGPEIGEAPPPIIADEPILTAAPEESAARVRPTPPARLYVGNLAFAVEADELRELFGSIGEVTDVQVVMDRDTGRPRGFAFITMRDAQAAKRAIAELDGATLENRQLRVSIAEERTGGRPGGGGGRRY